MPQRQGQPSRGKTAGRRIFGRAQRDRILDPYEAQHKPDEPSACPQCGAIYHRGRWAWGQAPEGAHPHLCAACRRIGEHLPAGVVTLHRPPARLKEQVIGLVRHEEAAEKSEHPLNRVMAIEEADGNLLISTTDIHLPRRIGEALKRAYHGELVMHFDDDGYFARIDWHPPG
jgi:hypothetical protein